MFSKIPPNGDEQSLRKLYSVRRRNAAGCFPNRENILLLSTFGREPLMYVQNRHPRGSRSKIKGIMTLNMIAKSRPLRYTSFLNHKPDDISLLDSPLNRDDCRCAHIPNPMYPF